MEIQTRPGNRGVSCGKAYPLVKPFLKWAGGKRQLLSEIKKHLPKNIQEYTYYEPFVGAGALFFDLQPRRAVINDRNIQLMLTYTAIKENVEGLIALLKQHKNTEEYFYRLRNADRHGERFKGMTTIEKAARLIFLNKTCFNGLYRVNSRGFFNVPYGKYKNPMVCEGAVLRQISRYLNGGTIDILSGDFEPALMDAGKNAFVYFDPPYHSSDKTGFTGYQAGGFNQNDQERLRDLMVRISRRGAKCLLSNSDTEYIRRLYSDDFFEIIPLRAKRNINADPAGRSNAREVLIKNWKDPCP
ncbi:MAG: DNA adenine methylase [Spirochaetaceae bacterium]|jgi:DNA adenine methylase|nr:DNA adenine methylase [Spirochaetaceae bacterium]